MGQIPVLLGPDCQKKVIKDATPPTPCMTLPLRGHGPSTGHIWGAIEEGGGHLKLCILRTDNRYPQNQKPLKPKKTHILLGLTPTLRLFNVTVRTASKLFQGKEQTKRRSATPAHRRETWPSALVRRLSAAGAVRAPKPRPGLHLTKPKRGELPCWKDFINRKKRLI